MTWPEAWQLSVLGYRVAFAAPLSFALILVALLVAAVAISAALRRSRMLGRAVHPRHHAALAVGAVPGRPVLKAGLCGTGLALLALAATQPQCGTRTELVKRRGIDVVVALDASKSMLARDVLPSRLERAKLELTTLLDQLKGDRVGLVAFAGEAFVQSPLTSDYAAVKLFLRAVDPLDMPQGGTNIGAALLLSWDILRGAERGDGGDRVVVLLSDGEDVVGEVEEGIEALKAAGVPVYAVAIGGDSGEPIPTLGEDGAIQGYQKDLSGQTVLTRLDRRVLARIAEGTGGELFHQPRGVAVTQVAAKIDGMQKSELQSRLSVRYDERFQVFAFPGLLAFFAGLVWPSGRRRAG